MKTLPLSEVKMKLSELVDQVTTRDEEVTITRNGRPVAILVSPEEFESWQETWAIRTDRELMTEIRRGLKGLRQSRRTHTVQSLFDDDR